MNISSFFKRIFGQLHWQEPIWIGMTRRYSANNTRTFWSILGVGLLVILSGIFISIYYKNLPKPPQIEAQITAPTITPLADDLEFQPLIINFGMKERGDFVPQSVAPLKQVYKVVTEGISLTPRLKGEWYWESDNRLVFTPEEDWFAGQTYHVSFEPSFFSAQKPMASYYYSFSTEPFQAMITDFKLSQDPVQANLRQAVATISFNYPVDAESLLKHASMLWQSSKKPIKFTTTYDKHKRTAYLKSENLTIDDVGRFLVLTLNSGIYSSTGSAETNLTHSKNLFIPDKANYFKINSVVSNIVRNTQDRPEQIITVEMALGVAEKNLDKAIHLYLLPTNYPATRAEAEKLNYSWQNPGEVTPAILMQARPLSLEPIATENQFATSHSYQFKAPAPGYLYIKIDKGLSALGDFLLTNDYAAIIPVPSFPKEISYLHKGALLALSSEKKLSVLVRGLSAVKFEIARVLPENINHLITQTAGDFNNPYFINQQFNQQNISVLFSEIQSFNVQDASQQQYTAIDLEKFLAAPTNARGPQGLFLLTSTGWDPANNSALDVKASRLILITDLGLLVKMSSDGSQDVFVQSIASGLPASGAEISVLGKNGLPILTRVTDELGHVSFPSLKDYVDDQEPVVYLAALNGDVSFIPYNNANRQLNLSRFEISGLYNNPETNSISAYVFSDRGIYRPGDTIHFSAIVKQGYANAAPVGLPLQVVVTDPNGTSVLDKKILLNNDGFLNEDLDTQLTSRTGTYYLNLYAIKDNHAQSLLGSTSIKLAEFLPDRMRIKSSFSPAPALGWTNPHGLKADVNLVNLYGAPASNRKVTGKVVISPTPIKFERYADYIFGDTLKNAEKSPKIISETLAEKITNSKGDVQFDLNLERYNQTAYQLELMVEGFEAESGRSVATEMTTFVSQLPYFIGYKPEGELAYIKQNSSQSLHILAIDPELNPIQVSDLTFEWWLLQPVTTLVKKENGLYEYQSIIQSKLIKKEPFSLDATGNTVALPSDVLGNFELVIKNKEDQAVSRAAFSIVGASQNPLAKNAELTVKLNQETFAAGDEIELQISAPYTGSGLLTIERDKVYATRWFKTDSQNSLQTIKIPEDFQGNGYVNIAFIRAWDSPEIFISPLSYAVVPFVVNHQQHTMNIDLDVPSSIKPGQPLTIQYKTDKPGKVIIFAVDEGILQVARYEAPDPLAFFFQKRALEVNTQQIVDQILPNYLKDRELSAVGGDGGEELIAHHLNPFKRKTDLPVVFWSDIINSDGTEQETTYNIPNYFNGSLRIMAVAVGANTLGSSSKLINVRGDFVINANVPTFVSLGDEFEVSASIANQVEKSGDKAALEVQISLSDNLTLEGKNTQQVIIPEKQEGTVKFKLHTQGLGAGQVIFTVHRGDKSAEALSNISIRPISPFMTNITSGMSQASDVSLPLLRDLYPEFRDVTVDASTSPLILMLGLQRYLDNYPYGCTEQLVSKAMPLLAMANQPWFKQNQIQIKEKINETITQVSQRQMSNGGFSYWPDATTNFNDKFASVYAMHFLTEAKNQSYLVPSALFY